MAFFKDNADREWKIRIDAPTIMRVREECDPQFLLNDKEDDNTYLRLLADDVLLCRVIYVICENQRKERDVSEEEFYLQVIGDAIDSAMEALLEAIVNFTPKMRRELFGTVAERTNRIYQKSTEMALKKINDPKVEEEILKELQTRIDQDVQRVLTRLGSASSTPDS